MKFARFAALLAAVTIAPALGQVGRTDLDGQGRPTPSQQERIQSAIASMRARAVFPTKGEVGETGEWIPPPTESVTFVSSGADFGASLDVGLIHADSPANATAVQNVLLPDPRINSVTAISTVTVTPTVAELSAFDVILVWTNSTPINNVLLGDNIATYVDGGGGCVLTMFAIRASLATRTIGGRFLADNYYCITQSVGATTTGAATLGSIVEPASELVDGVVSFDGGTSAFRSPAALVTNAVPVANWSTGQTLIAHREDLAGGRVDLNFFCVPNPTSAGSWLQTTDGRMIMVNALAMASKQNLWQNVHSQTPFAATTAYRNSNLPGISTFSDQQIADDFTIAGGAIVTDLTLWAVYTNTTGLSEVPPPLQEMTVRFFEDNAGLPGAQVSSSAGRTISFRDTGVDIGVRRVYQYRVSLLAAFVAEPGVKYWISPLGDTAGKTWAWCASAVPGGSGASRTGDAGPWASMTGPPNLAMILGSDEFHFGGDTSTFTFSDALRGNFITVGGGGQVLDRIAMKLSVPVGGATLSFYAMEANTIAGPFTPVFTRSAPYAGGLGPAWYSSGQFNLILDPSKVYFVGAGWNAEAVEFYRESGLSANWPLGSSLGSGGQNSVVNPLVGPTALATNGVGIEYELRLAFSIAQYCYANCDGSTGTPLLTANDFTCFINAFATTQSYANCDGSTGNPVFTANDFTCFINAYAIGCN